MDEWYAFVWNIRTLILVLNFRVSTYDLRALQQNQCRNVVAVIEGIMVTKPPHLRVAELFFLPELFSYLLTTLGNCPSCS